MNITLSVDEQIVERARTTAAAMGMSLNQAVRNYLGELAGQSSPEADIAEIEHLSLVAGGNRRGWRFDREHLHNTRSPMDSAPAVPEQLLQAGAATPGDAAGDAAGLRPTLLRALGLIDGTLIEQFEGQDWTGRSEGWVFPVLPVSAIGKEGKRGTAIARRTSHAVCG